MESASAKRDIEARVSRTFSFASYMRIEKETIRPSLAAGTKFPLSWMAAVRHARTRVAILFSSSVSTRLVFCKQLLRVARMESSLLSPESAGRNGESSGNKVCVAPRVKAKPLAIRSRLDRDPIAIRSSIEALARLDANRIPNNQERERESGDRGRGRRSTGRDRAEIAFLFP